MKLDLSCKGCPNCDNKKVAQGTQIAPLLRSNMIVDVLSMVYLFVCALRGKEMKAQNLAIIL
jgi:hypothetical protein